MTLYLIRHGQTRWNVEQRLQGRSDSPLTPLGVEQVKAIGALLAGVLPAAARPHLCASPLGRTRQTASLLAERLGIPAERCAVSALLAERDCGRWEGLCRDEVLARHGQHARELFRQWDVDAGHGGETLRQVHDRACRWLAQPRPGAPVLVVTHGILSRVFRGAYLGIDPAATMQLQSHTQDTVFELSAGKVTPLVAPAPPG